MNRFLIILPIFIIAACGSGRLQNKNTADEEKTILSLNSSGKGPEITVDLTRGSSFYYPLFAIWLEDEDGNYIQTLYVAKSVATGIFKYAVQKDNRWQAAPKRAPQTLPYWAHKRGVKATDGLYVPDASTTVPDAYTGATPVKGFIISAGLMQALNAFYKITGIFRYNDFFGYSFIIIKRRISKNYFLYS